jgi:sugar phosphate isomerase/epimerase
MTSTCFSRRRLLGTAGFAFGAAASKTFAAATGVSEHKVSFSYCLNTATLRGHKLPLIEEIEIAAKAGYSAVELWLDKVNEYKKDGGDLADVHKRIGDLGLTVENAIGFANWIVDDDAERARGLEQAKRDMETIAALGGKRMAAPPAGARESTPIELLAAALRYRALLEIGDQMGVTPLLELWGWSANIHRLGQAMFVAAESGHPKAALLLDVFHIYKGGSDFNGLKLLGANATPIFHINDYPAQPPRERITDAERVYPGDGAAPLSQILRDLKAGGGQKVLSLELFNPNYYKQDPLEVAKKGLAKMEAAIEEAVA